MAALSADFANPAAAAAAKPMNPAKMSLAKIKETAADFESVYLNSMLEEVFANVEEDGPFDGGEGTKIWRSLRTEEFARAIARAGGIGIAEHVERHLIAMQENRS